MCQTAFFNSLDDFCLWGVPQPNSSVGDSEARAVAYCTQDTHGTRVIPPGSIQAAQWIVTPSYIQVTGQIDQTGLNIAEGDAGGEMDPAGEDLRGNPLGGLVYTTAFDGASEEEPMQVNWWTNFMGGDIFCMKICVPGSENEEVNCEHIYDRSGCYVNMPSEGYFNDDTFETCEGDVGLPVGRYIASDGTTSTWSQPPLGEEIGTLPYNTEDVIAPSSECSSPNSLPAAFGAENASAASAATSGSGSASASAASSTSGSSSSSSSSESSDSSMPTASGDPQNAIDASEGNNESSASALSAAAGSAVFAAVAAMVMA